MKANNVNFAKGISIHELNSYNCALKNDYINNLIATAFQILPLMNTLVHGIEIAKGFISEAMAKDMSMLSCDRDRLYCKGLAISFKWLDYSQEEAIKLLKDHMFKIAGAFDIIIDDSALHCAYAKKNKTLSQKYIENDEIHYRIIYKE